MALCSLGVGCDEYGACYAEAMNEPARCGKPDEPATDVEIAKLYRGLIGDEN
jgi:hypothetical protein